MINNENKKLTWDDFGKTDLLPAGHALGEVGLLFEKIEDEAIENQINKLQKTKEENASPLNPPQGDLKTPPEGAGGLPVKEQVTFEDWEKLDIRVGTVLECAKVPKADKLLQFKIADGLGERTILSGIAQSYPDPEKLVGKQICFIANFAPRKLRGIDSEGMILSAEDADGKLVLIEPQREVKNGVNVG